MKDIIKSTNNPRIKEIIKLNQKKYRDKFNLFIVEGFHLVEEAKKAGIVQEILTSDNQVDGTLVSEEIIKKISSTKTPQPIIAICKKMKPQKLKNKVLVLNNLQDPGNIGTLIRTSAAFGWTDVIVQGVDIYSPKVLRSSQGSIFKINVFNTPDVSMHFKDYKIYGAVVDKDAVSYKDLKIKSQNIMLVLGNEGNGIEKNILSKLDVKVYIPISFESLNVAIAGGILLSKL